MKELSVKQKSTFMFASKYFTVFMNLIINAVLARIISPDDFGVVAIVSVFISFFMILSDIGIGAAVIQKQSLSRKEIDMFFSMSIYFSIILMMIFILFSILIAKFYGSAVYIQIGPILSLSLLFNTINTIPNALIMKKKAFVTAGSRIIVASLISGLTAILAAFNGFTYYALVIQTVLYAFIIFFWNYFSTKPKFIWKIDLECFNKIKEFSNFLFAFNVMNYFARNLDNLIIGRVMGTRELGYYDKAYKLMMYPVQNLTYVLNPIMHPILAEENGRKDVIYDKYLIVLKVLSLVGILISVFCFSCAYEIIYIVFGENWLKSIPAFKILSISVWFQITNSTSGTIYASINKTKLLFRSGIIFISIQVTLFLIASFMGKIEAIALGAAVGLIVKFFIDYFVLIKIGFEKSYIKFLGNFKAEIFIFIICYAGLKATKLIIIENIIISLFVQLFVCTIIFVIALVVTNQLKYIINFVKKK